MSVWKKASKANQKTHRERHQPSTRKHLGLLEKKKDYKKRADDHNEKQATLKLLRKRALNKNPDEFYHHMINSKIENGMHFEKETQEDTPEQIRLMKSQDLKYITTKRTQEMKKIEKLQAQLHLTGINHQSRNKHVYFKENLDADYTENNLLTKLSNEELPDINIDLLEDAVKNKKALYKQLSKRIERERELATIQRKIEIDRHLKEKSLLKPKRLRKGNKTTAPIYVWKYERKK